jgi:hypothetical protein
MAIRSVVRLCVGAAFAAIGCASACQVFLRTDAVQCVAPTDCPQPTATPWVCRDGLCVVSSNKDEAGIVDAGPSDPQWACLGRVVYPLETTDPIRQRLLVKNVVSNRPIVGAIARTCAPFDLGCSNPKQSFVSDDAGNFSFTSNFASRDRLSILGPDGGDFVPLIWLTFPPRTESIEADAAAGVPETFMATRQDLSLVAGLVSLAVDPLKGVVIGTTKDCLGNPSASIRAELLGDPGAAKTVYATDDGLFSLSRTETSKAGSFSFFNANPGVLQIRTTRSETGQVVGTYSVVVQAGAITSFSAPPTP